MIRDSRIVVCPVCRAGVGKVCKGRTQSHRERQILAGKAQARADARQRLSKEATEGVRAVLSYLEKQHAGLPPGLASDSALNAKFNETMRGGKLALDVAVAAVARLLRTRGAR